MADAFLFAANLIAILSQGREHFLPPPKNLHFAYSRVLFRLTISMLYGSMSFAQNSMQNEQMHFRRCTPIRTLNLSSCRLAKMVIPESHWNRKDPWKFACDQPDLMHLLFLRVLISFLRFCAILIHLYHCFCTEFLRSLIVYYSAQTHRLVSCLKLCSNKCNYKFATESPPTTAGFNVTSICFPRMCTHLLLKCCNKGKDFTRDFYPLETKRSLSFPHVHRFTLFWTIRKESLF